MPEDTEIRKLVYRHGGPAKCRRKLARRGINIPVVTVSSWTAFGKLKAVPRPWVLSLLERALK